MALQLADQSPQHRPNLGEVGALAEASHVRFKKKYSLPFTLLADPGHKIAEKYGVWGERNFAGRKYMGITRSTFVIDAGGNVVKAMHKVKPDGHPEKVLQALP